MTINLHQIAEYVAYWVLFWSFVNNFLPPREFFADDNGKTPHWYNKLLILISYYGSANFRNLTVKMYDSVQKAEPPIQKNLDAAASSAKDAIASIEDAKANITPDK